MVYGQKENFALPTTSTATTVVGQSTKPLLLCLLSSSNEDLLPIFRYGIVPLHRSLHFIGVSCPETGISDSLAEKADVAAVLSRLVLVELYGRLLFGAGLTDFGVHELR